MKKAIFINHTNSVFGAESVLLEVLHVCQLPTSQVLVIEPNYQKNSKFGEKVRQLGYNVLRVNYKNIGKNWLRTLLVLIYNIPACLRLCQLVKKEHYTVVYSNTSVTCLGAMVACLCKIEHIWHIHEPTEEEHGFTNSVDILYNYFFRKTHHIFFAACKQRQQWLKRFPIVSQKSIVLYNPVYEFDYVSPSHQECWFGYLGSRAKRKNIPSLIQAFSLLYTINANVRLLLSINEGEDNEIINHMISDLHLESIIQQRCVSNLSDFYNSIDVLVLPSYSETWGMVVLEAMQQGIATIVTTHTGLDELIQDKEHTLYIDPYDINSIFSAMSYMTNKQNRLQIGLRGKELLRRYNFNTEFKTIIQQHFYD